MNNYKIKVNSEAESKEAQELFLELGWQWKDSGKVILDYDPNMPFFYLDGEILHKGSSIENYQLCDRKEITLPELRDMVVLKRNDIGGATHYDSHITTEKIKCILIGEWWNAFTGGKWQQHCHVSSGRAEYMKPIEKTMKEFLLKDKSGTWHYNNSSMDSCPAHVDKVEIPEGAEFAVLNGDNEINFYTGIGLEKNHFISDAVVWQRPTQPEALPFIDDEPQSLNDQYAEIEQVRQMEIHGNVKAEPDFNFGAAQSKGGVDATLAERQTQYGCYEDVAQVTQQILSALRIGNYDKLPAPMKESLHMIASKMARIVNGDPKYLDNWHDIGGYAKLIEKLIKGE